MKQLLCSTRHIPDNKVSVIGNWLDARLFPVLPRDNGWRREVGISDEEFLVLFAGTLGYVSGADVLVEVGRILEHHAAALLVCVGEGVLREKMEHSAAAAGLRNLRFLPFQPSERVAQMHAAADATVLPTQAGHSDASVPSKLITYLAAGRPVVCAADEGSTVAQIVREANTGVLAEPGNAESIASALLFLVDHATERKQMGENARRYFEKHYTLERAYPQFAVLLKETRTCNAQ
jgi:colanic acid biosynthesis glycosyl transferase WcaI